MRNLRYIAPPASHDYCLQLVRNFDNENFVINTLLPKQAAKAVHYALRAFNVELVRIRSMVSNEDAGKLRIQFFRDALNAILHDQGAEVRSPVFQTLAEVQCLYPDMGLSKMHRLIDAREQDLGYPNFSTVSSLCAFARDVQSTTIHAHARCLMHQTQDDRDEDAIALTCDYAGEAIGLAILLRGAPVHAQQRITYVPSEVSRSVGVSMSELLRGHGKARDAFEVVARAASRSLALADDAAERIPALIKPAFWGLTLPRIYLRRLERAGFCPFDERLQFGMLKTYPFMQQLAVLRLRLLRR